MTDLPCTESQISNCSKIHFVYYRFSQHRNSNSSKKYFVSFSYRFTLHRISIKEIFWFMTHFRVGSPWVHDLPRLGFQFFQKKYFDSFCLSQIHPAQNLKVHLECMICQDSASILVHQLVARQQVHDLKGASKQEYFSRSFIFTGLLKATPCCVT